jgi:uncharacterized membrane protein YkoI
MRPWALRLHVLVAAVVGAQLLVWTGTGLAFTLFDFAEVRGTNDRASPRALDVAAVRVSPADAVRVATASRAVTVEALSLEPLAGRPTYRFAFAGAEPVLVDAGDGRIIALDRDSAARIATSAYRGVTHARGVERRRDEERDVFEVALDDRMVTVVSVDAHTGEIASWRNRAYRRFDALWSAHVLGYLDRRSPANWPLRGVALLALLVALSGTSLLAARLRAFVARRAPASPALAAPVEP